MTGRVYLDHNATMPVRAEARSAVLEAMDQVGNPSSVHAEGRAAKAIVEKARAEVAQAFGAEGADVIFTSGATEAAAIALSAGPEQNDANARFLCGGIEHDAVQAWCETGLEVSSAGLVSNISDPSRATLQLANSETGVVQGAIDGLAMVDATQAFGKIPIAFNWLGCRMAIVSAHKLGGPKGVGALIVRRGTEVAGLFGGGGQEMGRRAGTENVAGIAGFGAAAAASQRDLESGAWDRVEKLRNILEKTLAAEAKETIFVGNTVARLPNTSCILTPGWKGETQVMQMDLAGFAISAGSACSSGKVRASRVLRAMGYGEAEAASAIRVSLGPETTEDEVRRFCEAWLTAHDRFRARAA